MRFKNSFSLFFWIIHLASLCCVCSNSQAQIRFLQDSVQLGKLPLNTDSIISYDFKYVAEQDNYRIDSIMSDCACSVATYDKAPKHEQADTSYITVQYHTYKAGVFSKRFRVFLNGRKKASYHLIISGYILPAEPELKYPYQFKQLRVKSRFIHLGVINDRQVVKRKHELYNQGEQTIVLSDRINSPNHIYVVPDSKYILPKESINITVFYHPGIGKAYGQILDEISLLSTSPTQENIPLTVVAIVKQ